MCDYAKSSSSGDSGQCICGDTREAAEQSTLGGEACALLPVVRVDPDEGALKAAGVWGLVRQNETFGLSIMRRVSLTFNPTSNRPPGSCFSRHNPTSTMP